MSPSPVIARRRIRRPPRRFRGRNPTPKRATVSTVAMMAIRARMPTIRYALVVTAAWSIATGTYFAFRDDVLTRLISVQTDVDTLLEIGKCSGLLLLDPAESAWRAAYSASWCRSTRLRQRARNPLWPFVRNQRENRPRSYDPGQCQSSPILRWSVRC